MKKDFDKIKMFESDSILLKRFFIDIDHLIDIYTLNYEEFKHILSDHVSNESMEFTLKDLIEKIKSNKYDDELSGKIGNVVCHKENKSYLIDTNIELCKVIHAIDGYLYAEIKEVYND